MLKAIVAAKNQNSCDAIADIVTNCGFLAVKTANTGLQVREQFTYTDYELMVLYPPLEDEFGLELVADIAKNSNVAVIIISKNEIAEEIQQKLAFCGAFVLPRPINKAMLTHAIRYVMIVREQAIKLKAANAELLQKINDLKLIDRAKCVLIEVLKLSESQAHRYIQKQAMDQRLPQTEIAKNILKTYEL